MCAGLKVRDAQALPIWHCRRCCSSDGTRQSQNIQNVQPTSTPASLQPPVLHSRLAELRHSCPVVRRIPKSARASVANCLSAIIDRAVSQPSIETWTSLLFFAFVVLRSPEKSAQGIHTSVATAIKQQTQDINALSQCPPPPPPPPSAKPARSCQGIDEKSFVRRVQGKCADGDVKAALRIITSNEDFIQPSAEVRDALQQKHPPSPADEVLPPAPNNSDTPALEVTEVQVQSAIRTMPPGSAAGLDGMRPLHLKQLISAEATEPGRRLLRSITRLVNLILSGSVPDYARDSLFGASLCALRKKDGGLRPIAIGSVYRRLASRLAAHHLTSVIGPELRPVQMGVGTPLGCEAAVHATREFLTAGTSASAVVVKVDVRNAFNTVRRDALLNCIRDRCPEIYPLTFQAYSSPSPLHFGEHIILSSCGVQQGDPLGPVFFALAVDGCARSLKSPLNLWYLDDATIAGPAETVAEDLRTLNTELPKLGLELNSSKCELTVISDSEAAAENITSVISSVLPGIKVIAPEELTLLGSPLHHAGLSEFIRSAHTTISRLCTRVRLLDRHTALFFLSKYVSSPRVQYLLRSSPAYLEPADLLRIDDTVRLALQDVCNVAITDEAWEQAALPLRHGGLGVRSVQALALPSYVSSLTASAPLVSTICPSTSSGSEPAALIPAVRQFMSACGIETAPERPAANLQKTWDDIASVATANHLIARSNQIHRARLAAACMPHTAAWLQALPIPSLGLHIDDETIRIAVALRLGLPICEPHLCKLCGRSVDRLGHHGLSCTKSAGRFPRHAALNDVVKRALSSAGVPSILEPVGLDRGDGRRPDGLTTFPFSRGRSLAWDATCVDTFAATHVVRCAQEPGAAAAAAERRKQERYAGLSERYLFTPVAVETTGVVGKEASKLLRDIGGRISAATKDPREHSWLMQRISIAIIRGNSAAVLATAPDFYHPGRLEGLPEPAAAEPVVTRPAPAVTTDHGLFHRLIQYAAAQAPNDFDLPWGELFGARPKTSPRSTLDYPDSQLVSTTTSLHTPPPLTALVPESGSSLRSLLRQLIVLLAEGKSVTCEHVTNIVHCEADAATQRLQEPVNAQLLAATSEAGVRLEPGLPVLGRSGLPAPQLRLALSALVRHCGLGPLPP